MNTSIKATFILTYIFFAWVLYEMDKGWVTFGLGLGDYVYLYAIILWIVFTTVAFWKTRKIDFKTRKLLALILMTVLIASCVYTILMLTIYRGPELPWDGHLLG
jgi:hypothetical protein